jgi:hypothetical protein
VCFVQVTLLWHGQLSDEVQVKGLMASSSGLAVVVVVVVVVDVALWGTNSLMVDRTVFKVAFMLS